MRFTQAPTETCAMRRVVLRGHLPRPGRRSGIGRPPYRQHSRSRSDDGAATVAHLHSGVTPMDSVPHGPLKEARMGRIPARATDNPYLTLPEAAEYVGQLVKTLRRRIAAGALPRTDSGPGPYGFASPISRRRPIGSRMPAPSGRSKPATRQLKGPLTPAGYQRESPIAGHARIQWTHSGHPDGKTTVAQDLLLQILGNFRRGA